MIGTERNFVRTDRVFVGIIALGLPGFLCAGIFRYQTLRLLARFL